MIARTRFFETARYATRSNATIVVGSRLYAASRWLFAYFIRCHSPVCWRCSPVDVSPSPWLCPPWQKLLWACLHWKVIPDRRGGLVGNITSNEHSRTGTSRTCDSLTQVSQNVCLTDLNLLAIPAAARVSMTSSTNVSFILDFPCTTDWRRLFTS